MFTDKLYDHRFDIDDILAALCGDDHHGRWLLCTRDGRLIRETAGDDTSDIQDGDDTSHWHIIEPLPVSFLDEIRRHHTLNTMDDTQREDITAMLAQATALHMLPGFFDNGPAGGWIRERIKDVALEWLDMKNLVPPSMRHVRDRSLFETPPTPTKVTIS